MTPPAGRVVKERSTLTREILFENQEEVMKVLGRNETFLKALQSQFPVKLVNRGGRLALYGEGPEVDKLERMVKEILDLVRTGHNPTESDLEYALREASEGSLGDMRSLFNEAIVVSKKRPPVRARTFGQRRYLEAIRKHDIVFGIGPAGTGKTYLAMAMAVAMLQERQVGHIILTRPAVEAGESLGFLPGDMEQKVNPYLRPLYDALYDMLESSEISRHLEREEIEIAPLAYMRGRTLNNSFVILDEAQNTSHEQMKMFLTRLGSDSRTVVTGDITQIDLPPGKTSGLIEAHRILKATRGIEFVFFTKNDVVRHRLVKDIIQAYERREAAAEQPSAENETTNEIQHET